MIEAFDYCPHACQLLANYLPAKTKHPIPALPQRSQSEFAALVLYLN